MTREEAIKVLNMVEAHGLADEAKRVAIEALDERKVELYDDGTLVVNVKEGEKVGRVLIDGDDHFGGLYYIDAEPVVRCKDCKHNEGGTCGYSEFNIEVDDYCSYGERKE